MQPKRCINYSLLNILLLSIKIIQIVQPVISIRIRNPAYRRTRVCLNNIMMLKKHIFSWFICSVKRKTLFELMEIYAYLAYTCVYTSFGYLLGETAFLYYSTFFLPL